MNYLFLLLQLLATTRKNDMPVFYLDSVVVKGEATPTVSVKDSTLKMGKIRNVEHLFSLHPSLSFYVTGKGYAMLFIRGANSKDIKVEIDGVPLNIPYSGQFDLEQIPAGFVDGYSIIPPTTPLLMGSNAMGGILNISTSPIRKKAYTDISYGKGETFRNTIYFGQTIPFMDLSFTISYEKSRGFYISQNTPYSSSTFRKNSYSVRKGAMLKFQIKKAIPGNLKLSTLVLDNEKGVPWNILDSRKRYWKFPVWRNYKLQITHNLRKVKYGVFYDKYYNVLDSYDDSTFTTQTKRYAFHSTYDDYGEGGFIKISPFNKSFIKFYIKNDVHREQPDINKEWTKLSALTTSSSFYTVSNIGGSGIKTGIEYLILNQENHRQTGINGLIGISTVYKGISLSFAYSRRTRFPTLKEMYSTYAGSSYPNPDLKPEYSDNFEFDMSSHPFKNFKLSISTFYSRYKNLIERVRIDSLYKTVNLSYSKDYGFNFEIDGSAGNTKVRFLLNAEKARDDENQPLDLKPDISGTFILSKPVLYDILFYMNIHYAGKRYETLKDSTVTLSPYTILDVTLSKKIGRFEFYGKINNLLDEFYEYSYGFPARGRYEEVGLKISFK